MAQLELLQCKPVDYQPIFKNKVRLSSAVTIRIYVTNVI